MSAKPSPALSAKGSPKPSPLLKPEVATDGVVRIPKTVFESLPPPAQQPHNSKDMGGGMKQHTVVRLDGSIQTITTGVPPDNPNFKPRQAHPGGKIVTNDKLEVQLKFYERKGLPLTEEMKAKKAELEAAKGKNIWDRLGSKKAAAASGGGRVIKLGGVEGAVHAAAKAAAATVAGASAAASDTSPQPPRPPRPKGGVKVLSGAEGAMVGEKRRADEVAADGVTKQKVA